ncbi:nitroreductase family protein [Hamadaea sp. NPDC051192]|uniref:nitroreductase family protein n=1 Tax=Hamadaea sp. NPDC051192 TaxID=3154940 RepID=UPI00342423E4
MRHAILAECLDAAIAAPSIHNTQPWRFLPREHCVDVYADRSRRPAASDPNGRELAISVGAAVLNLRVALLARGYRPLYALLPEPSQADLLARVTFGGRVQPTYLARRLAGAIPRRRSNRGPFRSAELPEPVLTELVQAAAAEGAYLMIVDSPLRDAVLGAVRRAETSRRADPAYSADFAWPGAVEDDPTLAVLYGSGDSTYAWLRAGQALERVLLTATANGVQSTLMTQPLEYADLRTLFDDSALGRRAQAIIRLGYGDEPPASPRRALAEVIMAVPDEPAGTAD